MEGNNRRQSEKRVSWGRAKAEGAIGLEGIVPNPRLKLMDQVREVLRPSVVEGSAFTWFRRDK